MVSKIGLSCLGSINFLFTGEGSDVFVFFSPATWLVLVGLWIHVGGEQMWRLLLIKFLFMFCEYVQILNVVEDAQASLFKFWFWMGWRILAQYPFWFQLRRVGLRRPVVSYKACSNTEGNQQPCSLLPLMALQTFSEAAGTVFSKTSGAVFPSSLCCCYHSFATENPDNGGMMWESPLLSPLYFPFIYVWVELGKANETAASMQPQPRFRCAPTPTDTVLAVETSSREFEWLLMQNNVVTRENWMTGPSCHFCALKALAVVFPFLLPLSLLVLHFHIWLWS